MSKKLSDLDPMEYLSFNIAMLQYLMAEGASWTLIQAQIPSLMDAGRRALAAEPPTPNAWVQISQPVPDDVAASLADGETIPDSPEGL